MVLARQSARRASRLQQVAGETLVMKNHEPKKPVSNPHPMIGHADPRWHDGEPARPHDNSCEPAGRKAELADPVTTRYITLNEIDPEEVEWYLNLSGMHFDEVKTGVHAPTGEWRRGPCRAVSGGAVSRPTRAIRRRQPTRCSGGLRRSGRTSAREHAVRILWGQVAIDQPLKMGRPGARVRP